jgi:glutaredoxin
VSPRVLTYYTKAECPLCEKSRPVVERLSRRFGLGVRDVDVASDPALLERHGTRIPVLELDGDELGWGLLSERALERELRNRLG